MPSVFEECVDRVHALLADQGVECGKFRKSIEVRSGPRRVCWVPKGGRIEAPSTSGVRSCSGPSQAERVKVIHSSKLTVDAHIMAESFEALEVLHANVLNAVRSGLGNAAEPGAYFIATQSDKGFGETYGGRELLTQQFEFDLAVHSGIETLTVLTQHTHTHQFADELYSYD